MWTTRKAEQLIRDWKSTHPCVDCSERESRPVFWPYYVMEFDHTVPAEKRYTLGKNRLVRGLSEQELRREMAMCDLLCSNCHREREHRRRQHGRKSHQAQRGDPPGLPA